MLHACRVKGNPSAYLLRFKGPDAERSKIDEMLIVGAAGYSDLMNVDPAVSTLISPDVADFGFRLQRLVA